MFLKIKDFPKNSQFFIKYLISYTFILLVPVVILSFIVFGIFVELLKNEIINNTVNSLNKSKTAIDNEINQLYGISYQIMCANNSLNLYLSMQDSPTRDLYIKNEIRKHTASNFFISEVALYLQDDMYVYTNEGVYPLNIFINSIYEYENWTLKDFIQDITQSHMPFVRPAEKVNTDESYITIVYPNYKSSKIPQSSLIFLIPERKVQQLLPTNVNEMKGTSLIIDEKNQVITSSNYSEHINSHEFKYLINSLNDKDTVFEKKINGTKYFVFITSSNFFGWKYVSLIPVKYVMRNVAKAKFIYFIGLAVVFILGIILILLFMRVNYRPIRQLISYIKRTLNKDEEYLNEIELVRETIAYLTSQNIKLKNNLNENLTALRDSLIFSLIKGQIKTIEEFNKYGKGIGIEFSKNCFQIVIIQACSKDYNAELSKTEINRDMLAKIISSCIMEEYDYYFRDNIEANQYILLLAFNEDNKQSLNMMLKNMISKAKNEYNILLTMGVGDEYVNPEFISKSYMNASTALKYKFIKGNGQIIYYSDIISCQLKIEDYPDKKNIEELRHLIKQGNIRKIQHIIESVADYIRENNVPIFVAKGLCYEIIYEVLNADKDIIVRNKYPDIFLLEKIETMEELTEIIKGICLDVCSAIKARHMQEERINLIDKIINFIQQSYDNCNFDIQMIADNFGMTVSYLSQFFKSKTGKTILEFVTELRINKAKELLMQTDLSLNYIAEEVGYYNVSSFIRRFKQVEGITPGEFRKCNVNVVANAL